MEIRGIVRDLDLVLRRDVAEVVVLARRGDVADTEDFRFLVSFLGEAAGYDVAADLAVPREIHRDHRELRRRAALQKQHIVVVAKPHQRENVRFCLVQHRFELFGAVADLDDGLPRALEIQEFRLRFLQHFQRLRCGAGIEIVNAICFHSKFLLYKMMLPFYRPRRMRSSGKSSAIFTGICNILQRKSWCACVIFDCIYRRKVLS